MSNKPDAPNLPYSSTERAFLQSDISYHASDTVLDWVAWIADRYPQHIAIDSEDRRLTYSELDREASQLANCLLSHVRVGSMIAVLLDSRVRLVTALIGILRAGCVFVPLDPASPPERLRKVLTHLPIDGFVLEAKQAGVIRGISRDGFQGCKLVLTDAGASADETDTVSAIRPTLASYSTQKPSVQVKSDAMAYIYFTSGSTGEPKAIVGNLRGVSTFIKWEIETFGIEASCRVSQLTTPTFDAYLRDVLVPLCSGGTVCIPPVSPMNLGSRSFLDWIESHRINLIHSTPSLFSLLVDSEPKAHQLNNLRLVLLSGEFVPVSLVKRCREYFGDQTTLVNLYGATEATMVQFFHKISEADVARGFIPIGKPMRGVEAILLDHLGNVCPPGVIGEIFIKSPSLTLGYYGNPEATREAFVPNPLTKNENDIVYKTGDLALVLDDGNYKLLGRKDNQVKIRGVRVEPDEVASVLGGHPEIASCVVTTSRNKLGDHVLNAYVVSATRHRPSIPELRLYLQERLSREMMPSNFVFLEHLPLTANGKVDRAALQEYDPVKSCREQPYVAPRNELEEVLALIWEDVLHLEKVGVRDHFLDLGGHSLSATRIVSRVEASLKIKVSIRDIFDYPTIEELAQVLSGDSPRSSDVVSPLSEVIATPLLKDTPAELIRGNPLDTHDGRARAFKFVETASPRFGRRACNLIIVINEQLEMTSFEQLALNVTEFDPTLHTLIVQDLPNMDISVPDRPTLIFGPAMIRNVPTTRGRIFCGYPLSKSEEYTILEKAGIPVPSWVVLSEQERPDFTHLGEYVVRKPDFGAKGAEVKIVRNRRVRWKPIVTRTAGLSPSMIVQKFVYTGPRPVSYRVNTLFGSVLYALKVEAKLGGTSLEDPADFKRTAPKLAGAIVSNARAASAELCFDSEIIRLGERAGAAFPEIPLLGADIVKEEPSGNLFVLEVNAIGYNWNFRSPESRHWGDIEGQFNGFRKAAFILAEKTQKYAR